MDFRENSAATFVFSTLNPTKLSSAMDKRNAMKRLLAFQVSLSMLRRLKKLNPWPPRLHTCQILLEPAMHKRKTQIHTSNSLQLDIHDRKWHQCTIQHCQEKAIYTQNVFYNGLEFFFKRHSYFYSPNYCKIMNRRLAKINFPQKVTK